MLCNDHLGPRPRLPPWIVLALATLVVNCRQRIRLAVPGVLLCQDAEEGEGNRLHLMRFGSSVLVFLAGIAGNSLNAGILTGILKM